MSGISGYWEIVNYNFAGIPVIMQKSPGPPWPEGELSSKFQCIITPAWNHKIRFNKLFKLVKIKTININSIFPIPRILKSGRYPILWIKIFQSSPENQGNHNNCSSNSYNHTSDRICCLLPAISNPKNRQKKSHSQQQFTKSSKHESSVSLPKKRLDG